MKHQVVVIHGGDTFASYEEFFTELTNKILHLDRLRLFDWKNSLQKDLGDNFEVIAPRMPNPQNAKYSEWKIWFEKLLPHLEDGVILIGHSLGGSFLAKYLSENTFPKRIRATFLVAAPYDLDGDRNLHDFAVVGDAAGLGEQGGEIHLYHSTDDPVVSFGELGKYRRFLPQARVYAFSDRQHINQPEFPELVEAIRSLRY